MILFLQCCLYLIGYLFDLEVSLNIQEKESSLPKSQIRSINILHYTFYLFLTSLFPFPSLLWLWYWFFNWVLHWWLQEFCQKSLVFNLVMFLFSQMLYIKLTTLKVKKTTSIKFENNCTNITGYEILQK